VTLADKGFEEEGMWKPALVLLFASLAGAHAAVTLGRRRETDRLPSRLAGGFGSTAAISLAVLLSIAVIDETQDEQFYRAVLSALVLMALGTVLAPLLRRV
jgi:hypothetical protein